MHLVQRKSRKLYSSAARYDVDNENEQPKHQQNHENRPQHRLILLRCNLEIPKNPGTRSMGSNEHANWRKGRRLREKAEETRIFTGIKGKTCNSGRTITKGLH